MRKILLGLIGVVCALFTISAHALPAGYTEITPGDTTEYPETLSEYTMLTYNGNANWGQIFSSSGGADYYRAQITQGNTVVSGEKQFSNQWKIVAISSTNTNVGCRVYYTTSADGTFVSVRDPSKFTSLDAVKTYLNQNPLIVLYKSTTPTDNVFRAARRDSDGTLGYYCESGTNAGSFVVAYGMTEACDGERVTYTSATGTVVQNGTPTSTNPIEPVFYQQGNMVLRKVGDYADSYDATTGKITRRVGVKVLDGSENWVVSASYLSSMYNIVVDNLYAVGQEDNMSSPYSSHFARTTSWISTGARQGKVMSYKSSDNAVIGLGYGAEANNLSGFKSWLQQQYNAGTPVTVWYPLAEPVEEDWTASYCQQAIKVATTKYVETQFSGLSASLAAAVATVNTVVTNTINQATSNTTPSIATLQSGKQTRPADDTCPAYKQCLLVEDEQGVPHWYQITDPFRDFVAPIIANNVNAASSTSTLGYTQLEYIESTGTQYIDTGFVPTSDYKHTLVFSTTDDGTDYIAGTGTDGGRGGNVKLSVGKLENIYIGSAGASAIGLVNNPSSYTVTSKKTLVMDLHNNAVSNVFLSGQNISSGNVATIVSTNSLHLFGSVGASPLKSRIYQDIIEQNGVLVRNFVPVIDNATGKVGLYDTVGGRFYGNAATSGADFTPGPIVDNDADVPGMTWSATWAVDASAGVSAGTVYGIARCNNVNSTAGTIITDTTSTAFNTLGAICHCKMTSIDFEGSISDTNTAKWVHVDHANGGTTVCLQQCSVWCRSFTTMTERNKPVLSSVL